MSIALHSGITSANTLNVPVLEVANLSVGYRGKKELNRVVHDVSLQVRSGEVVALVGESGSGKTTTAQAVIGLLAENGRLEAGAIRLNGTDISGWSQKRLDTVRGSKISLIPQDPTTSLNPVMTIGDQVAEIFRIHGYADRKEIDARVVELLARVRLSQPEMRIKQYPHELSGGMRQRVLIAIAIALRPALIVADEPTSALDVTVQKRILDLLDDLRREYGTAVLLVTHDLGVAADRASYIVVMKGGRIQEQGPVKEILASPNSDYTRQLLADAPSLNNVRHVSRRGTVATKENDLAIVVEDLVQDFPTSSKQGVFRAVDGVSFAVPRGTTHAIVGESGSGKTTTTRSVVGFQKPTSGRILVDGIDVTSLRGESLRQFRKKIQLVYQNPFSSLDPLQTIFQIVEEPLLNFETWSREDRARKVHSILDRVGLPQSVLTRKPRALSGGQRQRVAIARALVLDPQILVLDEAVSALDVTVQAQILMLLDELQRTFGLTYLFISHDLAVVRQISDTVSVLHNGRQVDIGKVEDIFENPGSAYTRELISAIPGQHETVHM